MIYNSSLYNDSLYNGLSDNQQNVFVERISCKCYQNNEDNIIIYWKHVPFNELLFSSDYFIETDINPQFNSQYYQINKFSEFTDKIINEGNIGVILYPNNNKTFEYALNTNKEIYIRISIDNISLSIEPHVIRYKVIPNKMFYYINIIKKFLPENILKPFKILTSQLGYKYYDVNSNLSMIIFYILNEIDKTNAYLESFNNNILNSSDYQINDLATIYGIEKTNNIGILDFRDIIIGYSVSSRFSISFKSINSFVYSIYTNYPMYEKIYNSELYTVNNAQQTELYFVDNDSDLYLINRYMFFDGIKIIIRRKNKLSFYDNFCRDIINKFIPSNIYYELEFVEV